MHRRQIGAAVESQSTGCKHPIQFIALGKRWSHKLQAVRESSTVFIIWKFWLRLGRLQTIRASTVAILGISDIVICGSSPSTNVPRNVSWSKQCQRIRVLATVYPPSIGKQRFIVTCFNALEEKYRNGKIQRKRKETIKIVDISFSQYILFFYHPFRLYFLHR